MVKRVHNNFEYKFFHVLLFGSLFLWIYRIAVSMYTGDTSLVIEDSIMFIITFLFLYLVRIKRYFDWLRTIYCLVLVIGYFYYWKQIGGIHGPVTYAYFALITIFVIILPFRFRSMLTILLGTVAIVLALDSERSFLIAIDPMADWTRDSIPYLYVMGSSAVAILVVTLKWNFDKEKRSLEKNNAHLDQVNSELAIKIHDLMVQKEEIESIKENLELFVTERTMRLEHRHERLEEYAYNNAHVVRRYLSNIIGLLDVIELENLEHQIDPEVLKQIRESALELDRLIRQVNSILN